MNARGRRARDGSRWYNSVVVGDCDVLGAVLEAVTVAVLLKDLTQKDGLVSNTNESVLVSRSARIEWLLIFRHGRADDRAPRSIRNIIVNNHK
jgi:hypothetical protein